MAYNYRYRKFPRKYKKTLKKSNIFSRRSPKAQAKQIYSLNKKVNYIQRTTKPELQVKNGNIMYQRFLNNGQPEIFHHQRWFLYEDVIMNANTPATSRINLQGSMMRVKSIKLFGQFGVYNDTSLSGPWAVQTSKNLIENDPSTAYLRIVVCRMKKGGGKTPTDIFYENPNENALGGTAYDCSYVINGPLQKGVSAQLDIIKDKKIKVDISHPYKLYSMKLSAKKLGYIYRKPVDTSPAATSGENELIIYTYYCCPALLNYQSPQGVTTSVGPQCYATMNYNICYTDQN